MSNAVDLTDAEKRHVTGQISREAEDAVRQSRHYCNLPNQPSSAFPNSSFGETGSLMLLRPY